MAESKAMTTPDAFEAALAFVLEAEGGATITNDPDDSGGLTRWGVTSASWVEAQARGIVARDKPVTGADRSDAAAIYRAMYWEPMRCDRMIPALAFVVFDTAVNLGTTQAALLLQRLVRVEPDGVVGVDTLAAIRGRSDSWIIPRFVSARVAFYEMLIARKPSQAKFADGWRWRALASLWVAARMSDPIVDNV